jgi:hypothetical protein
MSRCLHRDSESLMSLGYSSREPSEPSYKMDNFSKGPLLSNSFLCSSSAPVSYLYLNRRHGIDIDSANVTVVTGIGRALYTHKPSLFVYVFSHTRDSIAKPDVITNFMQLSPSWEDAKCEAVYGTWKFITMFTRALHWSLSWTRSIQFIPPHPISLKSILILSSHLRLHLPIGFFHSGFPANILYAFLFSSFVLNALPISASLTWSF